MPRKKPLCELSLHETWNQWLSIYKTCHIFQKNHHSLLHFSPKGLKDIVQRMNTTTSNGSNPNSVHQPTAMLVTSTIYPTILLSTMAFGVYEFDKIRHTLCALLDTGDQASFITINCADRLALPHCRFSSNVIMFSGVFINIIYLLLQSTLCPRGSMIRHYLLMPWLFQTLWMKFCNLQSWHHWPSQIYGFISNICHLQIQYPHTKQTIPGEFFSNHFPINDWLILY